MACNLKTSYMVADGEVKLTVVIGDGQLGASIVFLNTTPIEKGEIKDQVIGLGKSLHGSKLLVKTVVSDVNDQTNHTCITYILTGGVKDNSFSLEATVANEGDSIIYKAEFDLI
jgi:hypothetical protein